MTRFFFDNVLLPQGWAEKVLVEADKDGWITSVTSENKPQDIDFTGKIAVPGVPNCHSHAFQRAMAGLTEVRGQSEDSFWTWRDLMYRFVDKVTPEDLTAIAALAYLEMLESGYTAITEFHYLHHAPDGQPFDDISEMSQAILQAAQAVGIGMTLLPVFYESAGFGGTPPGNAQRRFANNPDRYGRLIERVQALVTELPHAVVGMAPHSLRAATPEGLQQILALPCDGPVHIHIAEQIKEVEDCIAWSGARPVAWLLDQVDVTDRWCLVHATHLDAHEISGLAQSGAVAGLCPITEANLGDGIFEGVAFREHQGRMAIGSDSNVFISVAEELRMLEYSQRLRDKGRNKLVDAGASNGRTLFDTVLAGGAQASGRRIGRIEPGFRADFVALDENHPGLMARHGDAWLDGWIFAGDNSVVRDVWAGGRQVVQHGRHVAREKILAPYAKTLGRLLAL